MFSLQTNQKKLLKSLNPLLILMWVFGMILFLSTARPLFPFFFKEWEILLPVAIYFGQRRNLPEGVVLTLFASHLYSLSSGAPIGIFIFHYLIIFLLARAISTIIYANQWGTIMVLMMAFSFLSKFILFGVALLFDHHWSLGKHSWIKGPIINACLGLLCYWFLGFLDKISLKSPRTNIRLTEEAEL